MSDRCHICHRPAQVGNPELAATLCYQCDAAFLAWYATHPGRDATDYPAWNRHRTRTTPLRINQANTLTLLHQYREQASA